jgi:MFS family permease
MVRAQQRSGVALEGVDASMTRSTIVDMFTDPLIRRRLIPAFLMMLSVTFGFWGVATFVPTFVGGVAKQAGLDAPFYSAIAGLVATGFGIFGFIALGFLADWIGRKPTAMLYYAMSLILTPVLYIWAQGMGTLLVAVAVFGFFTTGIWSWAPIWLPELFPTRVRGTAVAFCFNAPRWISCTGPLIAGTLIVALGGFGNAATIVGFFFILGVVAAPFLPETKGQPLPHALWKEAPAELAGD